MGETITVRGTRGIENAFIPRLLKYKFIGGKNQNGEPVFISKNEDNSRVLSDFRSEVSISTNGGYTLSQASITIYNMPIDLAKTISNVGFYDREALTTLVQVEVYASLDCSTQEKPQFARIFQGGIVVSYADLNAQPNPNVRIEAQTLGGQNTFAAKSISFKGDVPVIDIVKRMVDNYRDKNDDKAAEIISVENNGVTATMNNPNYHGSFVSQLHTLAHDADFEFTISNRVLHLYPINGNIQQPHMLFSLATGMIGYPSYSGQGMIIKSLFKPSLKFAQAIKVYIEPKDKETKNIGAIFNGKWDNMVSMTHDLSCQVPNGPWFTTIEVAKQKLRGSLSNGS